MVFGAGNRHSFHLSFVKLCFHESMYKPYSLLSWYILQTAAVAVAIVGLLAINLIRPWYSSDTATELLGTVFEVSAQSSINRSINNPVQY